jgi:transposase
VSTGHPFVYPNGGTVEMIVIGADTHKRSHTVGAVDAATGRVIADRRVKAKRRSFEDLLLWARGVGGERVWAIEDCRHVSGALERFLLARGERVVRVPPKVSRNLPNGCARTVCSAPSNPLRLLPVEGQRRM